MSRELVYVIITKMHIRLNWLIADNNFDLMSSSVQRYSKRLDRILTYYGKTSRRISKKEPDAVKKTVEYA